MKTTFSERARKAWDVLMGSEEIYENQDLLDEISELKSALDRFELIEQVEKLTKAFSDVGMFMDEKNEFTHKFCRTIDALDMENFFKCTSKVEREEYLSLIRDSFKEMNESAEWSIENGVKDTPLNRIKLARKSLGR